MKSDKLINFGELLGKAWKFVWKFKYLWLLGLLAGGNAGASGNNFSYLFNSNSNSDTKDWQSLLSNNSMANNLPSAGKVLGATDTALPIIVMILAFIIILILAIVTIYLNITARGAIISAVDKIDQDKKISLGESWSLGHKYFWRIFGFSIVYSLLIIIPMLFLATPVAIMAAVRWYVPAIIVGIIFALIFIVYAIYLALFIEYGERILVLQNKSIWDSIKHGAQFLNKNWKNVLLTYLVLMAVMAVAGVALVICILLVGGTLAALVYGVYLLNSIAAIVVGILVGLAFFVAFLTASGLIASYRSSVLTLAYKEITSFN